MTNGIVTYEPTSFSELEVFCKRICATGMVPTSYRGKPDDAAVAIMYGNEIGLPPMTALQFIAVINGRPAVYGDALPGLAMTKGMIRDMREYYETSGENVTAVCEVTRPNGTVVTQRFSVADARKAGLWDKAGPWKQYPRRMLQWRARSWAIRDAAPHAMFGPSAEELQDIDTAEQHRGPDAAREINPADPALGPRAAAQAAMAAAAEIQDGEEIDEIGEVHSDDQHGLPLDDPDPLMILGLSAKEAIGALEYRINQADAAEADRLLAVYRTKLEKSAPNAYKSLGEMVTAKIEGRG